MCLLSGNVPPASWQTMALTFAQQKLLSEQLVNSSTDSALGDVQILHQAKGLALHISEEPRERAALEQLVGQVGSELYAERGRGTRARHLARGALLLLADESRAEERSYDPVALLRFCLDEIVRADGDSRVLSRWRLTERDRKEAERIFEGFCDSPAHPDKELIEFASRVVGPTTVEPVLSARFHADVEFVAEALRSEASPDSAKRLARGALSYLAENNDAIRDDIGPVGFTDDRHILSAAAGLISPARRGANDLVDTLLERWPFLTRFETSHAEGLWAPSLTTLLTSAAVVFADTKRVAIVLPRTAGVALCQGVLLALGALASADEPKGPFRPRVGDFISPVDKTTPAEVEGYYDEDLRPCDARTAVLVALKYSPGARKPPVKRYTPVSDLSRYVRTSPPRKRDRVDLRDRASDVRLGPLETLFGRTRPVQTQRVGKRVVVVAPLQASRDALVGTTLLGRPLADAIPCGRIRFDEGTVPEMWSGNAPSDATLLTIVRNTAQAAILAERWRAEEVAVVAPVDEPQQ